LYRYSRDWRYNPQTKLWFSRVTDAISKERGLPVGSLLWFDYVTWTEKPWTQAANQLQFMTMEDIGQAVSMGHP